MFGQKEFDNEKIRYKLTITKDEIEEDDRTLSEYLIWRACEKANRLGLVNYKLIEVAYEKDGEDWEITFVTEKDWI